MKRDLPGLLPRLWRFAMYLTHDGHLAEDLVQSTCVRAIERAAQFAAGTRLDSWTFTIMASVWKNDVRASSNRARHLRDYGAAMADENQPTPELGARTSELMAAIETLPDGQRAAVALVYVEGYAYKEAALILDIPIGTVMSRLAGARKALAHLNQESTQPAQTKGGDTP